MSIFIELFSLEKFDKKSLFLKINSINSINQFFEAKKSYLRVVQVVVLQLKGTKKSKKQQIMAILDFFEKFKAIFQKIREKKIRSKNGHSTCKAKQAFICLLAKSRLPSVFSCQVEGVKDCLGFATGYRVSLVLFIGPVTFKWDVCSSMSMAASLSTKSFSMPNLIFFI
jgi:hypothetical protein